MFPTAHGIVSQGGGITPPEPGAPQYGVASMPGSPSTFSTTAQRGPVYAFSQDVTATGARIWMPAAGAETVRLWRVSDQTLLASVEITAAAGSWVEGNFDSHVALAKDTQYLIATRRTNNASRSTVHAAASGFTFHPLVTFIHSRTTETNAFPTNVNANVLGLADILFAV